MCLRYSDRKKGDIKPFLCMVQIRSVGSNDKVDIINAIVLQKVSHLYTNPSLSWFYPEHYVYRPWASLSTHLKGILWKFITNTSNMICVSSWAKRLLELGFLNDSYFPQKTEVGRYSNKETWCGSLCKSVLILSMILLSAETRNE